MTKLLRKSRVFLICILMFTVSACTFNTNPGTDKMTETQLWKMADDYLSPIFAAGITNESWSRGEEIDADNLLTFYMAVAHERRFDLPFPEIVGYDDESNRLLPEKEVNEIVRRFFEVTPEHLHTSAFYNADTKTYIEHGLGGASSYKITNVTLNGDTMEIDFKSYQDDVLMQNCKLFLRKKADLFLYESCDSISVINDRFSVDINDLDAITKEYLYPLDPNGRLLTYEWKNTSQINPDDLIDFCAFNKFLGLEQDFEGVYLPECSNAPAEAVEAAVQLHFDVTSEQLRTSSRYDPATNTYVMLGGWGGGWHMQAVSTYPTVNGLEIKLASYRPLTEEEAEYEQTKLKSCSPGAALIYEEDRPELPTLVIPTGTLTIEITEDKTVRYISNIF